MSPRINDLASEGRERGCLVSIDAIHVIRDTLANRVIETDCIANGLLGRQEDSTTFYRHHTRLDNRSYGRTGSGCRPSNQVSFDRPNKLHVKPIARIIILIR